MIRKAVSVQPVLPPIRFIIFLCLPRKGIAAALMQRARTEAKRLGHDICYLCAEPKVTPYYLARGFTQIETDVAGLNVFSIPS